jgi:hypothetical protein
VAPADSLLVVAGQVVLTIALLYLRRLEALAVVPAISTPSATPLPVVDPIGVAVESGVDGC